MGDYCIKDEYSARSEVNRTKAQNRETDYWNEGRIQTSKFYQWPTYNYASKFCQKHGIKSVADVGTGTAIKLNQLIKPHVETIVGIDQKSAVEFCREYHDDGRYVADDLEREESSIGEHFDLIICSDVIEHVVRPDNLLSYIHSICHKRSQMILSTPDRDRLRGVHNQQSPKPEHIREWNYEELEAFLVSSDYEVTEHFHQFPMCLSRNSWKTFLRTMAKQILKFRHPKYNQVVLARVSS